MIKKITYLFTMFFLVAFSWQGKAQLTQDFETNPPAGWTFMATETDDPGFEQTTAQAHSGSASFYHNDVDVSVESTAYMISPAYTVVSGDELRFWYYQNYSTSFYTYNGVWISTASGDPITNPGDFSELHEFGEGGSEDAWSELIFDLSTYVGQTIYIAFKYTGDYSDEIYIDDFSISTAPTCATPTNLVVSSMTAPSTAGFTWDAVTGASGYNFEIQPQGTAQGTAGASASGSTGGNSFNATGLVVGTDYTVYVQTDCGGGDTSTYISLDFTFSPPPANDDCSNAIVLTCGDSLTNQTTLGATGGSSTSCQASIGDDVWYSFVGNDAEVIITVNSTTTGEEAQVDVYASTDGTCAGFTPGTCDSSLVQSSGGNNPYSATFSAVSGTTYFIAVGNFINGYSGINFDLTVACITCPTPSNLTTTNITATSAQIDWTENGGATLWNVEYKAGADFTPGAGEQDQMGSFAAHPYGLAGFQPNTTYYWYVQADCGGGDTSEWVGTSFTTLASCPAPSNLTSSNITQNSAELDWTENGSSTAWNFEMKADIDFTPGNNEWEVSGNTSIHPFTPGVSLDPNTTYYWYVRSDCGGGDTSDWVGSSFTTLNDATPDFYNIQWLSDGTNGSNTSLTVDAWTTVTAYAQVYEAGLTDAAGQAAGIECWIGGNSENTDPSTWDDSNWEVAVYNADSGNNDEYKLEKAIDFTGTVYIAARWRLEGNGPFVYGGYNGAWDGTNNNSIQLTSNAIVANDDCDGAVALTVNPDYNCDTVTSGTTVNATESSQEDDVTGTPNTDVWYSFVATNAIHRVSISNVVNQGGGTSTSTDMGMGVYDASGGCDALVLFDDSDPNTLDLSGLTVGNTYYVRVYGWFSSVQFNTFDICIGTPPAPPANDACVDATPVYTLPYTNSQDATGATNNDGFITDCGLAGMNDGVWYTFTVETAGDITVEVTPTDWDPQLDIYTGACGAFTCVDQADSGSTESITFTATAGTQYWVNIGYWSGSTDGLEGPFDISITSTGAVLGIANNLIDGFNMYPNPVTNTLNLKAQDAIDTVSIYNMLGQEVLRSNPSATQVQMDMSSLPTATYIVKVQAGNQVGTYNLIKQ